MASLFGQQLLARKGARQEAVEQNLLKLGDTVMGDGDRYYKAPTNSEHTIRQVELILQYFKLETMADPPVCDNLVEQIDVLLEPSGAMKRRVLLSDKWWSDSDGPLLATIKGEDPTTVALLPNPLKGYSYYDPDTGKRVKVTEQNKDVFEGEAFCFYKPLPLKPLTSREYVLFLLSQLRLSDVLLLVVAGLGVSLVGILTPLVTKVAFSSIIPAGQKYMLVSLAALLVSTSIGAWMLRAVQSSMSDRISNRLNTVSQNAVFSRMMNLPMSFFDDKSSGGLAQQLFILNMLPSVLCSILLGGVLTIALSLVNVYPLFSASASLVMPSLIVVAVSILLFWLTVREGRDAIREQFRSEQKNQGVVYDFITGIQKIKLSGSEDMAYAKWLEAYTQKASVAYRPRFFTMYLPQFLAFIRMAGMLWAYVIAFKGGLSVTQFAVFSSAYGLIMSCVSTLAAQVTSFSQIGPIMEIGEPMLMEMPEQGTGKTIVTSLTGGIDINNVTFRYSEDGPAILNDLSLSIRPGEYVAIVGKTGCGKSTLMKLLLGFIRPQKGAVLYDNLDMERMNLRSLRRNIGVVLQDGKLFTGDIYSNITISAPWLTLDDAWEAAEKAGVADFIHKLPMGMDTLISEGSGGISGGQRQRLLIARAVATKSSVLMLDEATSALDNLTQKIVTDSLGSLNCTRIVIAHRLSTIRDCDRIIALDGGRIVESGTYDELVAKKGFFAELVERQQIGPAAE